MKGKQFFDLLQAQSYLNNSVIRCRERAVYIEEVSALYDAEGFKLVFTDLITKDRLSIATVDPAVDYTPVPLGFVNKEDMVYLVRRVPVRGWKIGLAENNISTQPIIDTAPMVNDLLLSPNLAATIHNEFPSAKTAVERLTDDATFMAFSRRFALDYEHGLYFKDYGVVGEWSYEHELECQLDTQYLFLNEMLGEDIHEAHTR